MSDEKRFQRGSQSAAQLRRTSDRSSAVGRQIIADDRIFMRLVEFPPAAGKDVEPLFTPFFDSLELMGAKSLAGEKPRPKGD